MTMKLSSKVSRGKRKGARLTPHAYEDGQFVVSKSRFEADYIRVRDEGELPAWVEKGYSVRMSYPGGSPRLIRPASIQVDEA